MTAMKIATGAVSKEFKLGSVTHPGKLHTSIGGTFDLLATKDSAGRRWSCLEFTIRTRYLEQSGQVNGGRYGSERDNRRALAS